MVKVEGIYRNLERIGQELLCNWVDLPTNYREQLFQSIPEDFDIECFYIHLNYARKKNLRGYTFINIKPQTFIHYWKEILDSIDRRIVIELREDWVTEAQLKKLIEIRESYPFLLSIDDFGRNASNLDRVHALAPDFLKIDVKLFEDRRKELIQFVFFIKNYTEAVLIAERVETEEDYRTVRSAGIELWSGFYEQTLFRSSSGTSSNSK